MATAARELVPASASRGVKQRGKRGGLRNPPGGRPQWKPELERKIISEAMGTSRPETEDEAWERCRQLVRHYVAIGYPQDVIARLMRPAMSEDTLAKHFRYELDHGKLIQDAKVAGTAFWMATNGRQGDMTRFWLRARCGWRDHGDLPPTANPIQFRKIEGDDW